MRIAGEGAAETQRYAGAELGATIARDVAPGNTAAELLSAVAGSTAINTLQSLDPRDLNRVMTGMTQVYSHRPTPERPFVGRLDSYIANLDVGRISPKELLARMQGKFRGPELLRVERAFDGADMNAKLTPSEVLEKLQGAYDPSDLELVTLRKPAPYRDRDNPWEDSPDSMQSTIILRRSGQAVPSDIAKRAESAKKALGGMETLRAENLLDPDILESYTESLARAFSGQRDGTSQFVLERVDNLESLARGRQEKERELGVILSRAGEVSQELFDAEKTRLLQQGGMPSRDLLNQAYVNAFKQHYDNLVAATASASRYPDNFNNLPTPDNVTTPEQATEFIQRTLEYAIDERIFRLSNSTRARIAEQLNLLRNDVVYNELKRLSSLKVPMTPPGVNPKYTGQHTSVTDNLPGVISFSRATDTTADIPGMGQTQGIYLHELQSDLLDDLRTRGLGIPRGATPKELDRIIAKNKEQIDALEQKRISLQAQYDNAPVFSQERTQIRTQLNTLVEQQTDLQARYLAALEQQEGKRRPSELDEAFPGMVTDSKSVQTMMIKAAVSSAMQRGLGFVALPSQRFSSQKQLYERLPQNAKEVVKDLGEGFTLQQINLRNRSGEFPVLAITWDQSTAEGREGLNRVITRGVPFKHGGEVTTDPEDVQNLISYLNK